MSTVAHWAHLLGVANFPDLTRGDCPWHMNALQNKAVHVKFAMLLEEVLVTLHAESFPIPIIATIVVVTPSVTPSLIQE